MAIKKILYVATVDSHIRAFHLPYLKMMQEKGWETHVATNGKEKIPFCDHRHTICMERSPFKPNNLRAIKQMKQLLEKEHFDIIHCHTPMGSVVTRLAAKKARKNGTRIIYTAHGFHFYTGAPLINWLLFYPVEWYLAKYTDTLITINHEDYNRAKKKFSKRCHDIQYVPGVGINPKKFDFKMTEKEKHELRTSLRLKDDDFVMICVGRLDKNKNQSFLIKCMSELVKEKPKAHLLLVGQDELNGKYQRLAKKLGVGINVHFLGQRKDIPKLLKISDLAVSSSKREGLPVNIIESSITGIQIVTTGCRGVSDILKDYNNISTADDKNSFEKKIKEASTIKNKGNINAIKQKFCIDSIATYLTNIYFREKRILFIHGAAWLSKDNNGTYYNGPQYNKRTWDRYLALSNNVSAILRYDGKIISKKQGLKLGIQSDDRIRMIPIHKPNRKNPFNLINTTIQNRNIIKQQVIKNDVIVARIPSIESCYAVKIANKLNKTTIVEVVGCSFDSNWNHSLAGKIVAIPHYIAQRMAIRKSSGVIYVTNNYLQKKYPTNANKIACSDVQIENSNINYIKGSKLTEKIKNNEKLIIGTIGNIDIKYKGHKYAIKALSKLKQAGFIFEYQLVGSGNKKKIIKTAKKNSISNNVKIMGHKNHNDVIKWLKSIDIYIQPSTTEGLCRSLIEAMNCGCYCIASDAGGNPELLDDKYIFKNKDSDDLFRKLRNINKEKIEQQIEYNKRAVLSLDQFLLDTKRVNFMRSIIK